MGILFAWICFCGIGDFGRDTARHANDGVYTARGVLLGEELGEISRMAHAPQDLRQDAKGLGGAPCDTTLCQVFGVDYDDGVVCVHVF